MDAKLLHLPRVNEAPETGVDFGGVVPFNIEIRDVHASQRVSLDQVDGDNLYTSVEQYDRSFMSLGSPPAILCSRHWYEYIGRDLHKYQIVPDLAIDILDEMQGTVEPLLSEVFWFHFSANQAVKQCSRLLLSPIPLLL